MSHPTTAHYPTASSLAQRPRCDTVDTLRVCHFNATCLRGRHIWDIREHLAGLSDHYHVIAVSETWFGSVVVDALVALDGYTLMRQDRNIQGGGVALYIHESLTATRLHSSSTTTLEDWGKPGTPEFLYCEVVPRGGIPIFVGVVYRPPGTPFYVGTDLFPSMVTIMGSYGTKIILGDFNADQLSSSEDASVVRNFIEDNALYSVPFGPTHHTATSDTWLDLCLVDMLDTVIAHSQTEAPFIAGHDLITATLDVHVPPLLTPDFTYRDFKSIDADLLNDYLRTCDWTEFEEGTPSLEAGLNCLYRNLDSAVDIFAPVKTCTFGKGCFPWFTAEIRRLKGDRDRLYMRYRRTRLDRDLEAYRRLRDQTHFKIETARLDFSWARLRDLSDPAQIWDELRRLGVAPSTSSRSNNDFSAEDLNAHFASVSYDDTEPSLSLALDDLRESDTEGDFTFHAVTAAEVSDAVNYSTSQAVGTDGLSQGFIKKALPTIILYLCSIFNESIRTSTFPDRWKQSVVLPLNKIPSPKCLGDFRPIALLCFFSKVFERLIYIQLSTYLVSKRSLDPLQAGYRPGHSTQTILLKLTDDIRHGMDKRLLTALLMFDFSKAFDTVCHKTLLGKLRGMGLSLRALEWVASYLSGRTQAVRSSGSTFSSFRPLNKGVPQGSVLGPLLFIIYVSDIARLFGVHVRYIMYADDLGVYVQGAYDEIHIFLQRLSEAAGSVLQWAAANRSRVNVGKTKAMIFGTGPYVDKFNNESGISALTVGDEQVSFVPSARSLGVVLDSKLDWKEHVRSITARVNSLLYRLYHFRRSTDFRLRKHLVMSLLFPIIDYCSLVYCDLTAEQNQIIQTALNKGIRYIYGIRDIFEHITPYRRELEWLTAAGRRDYFAAVMLYKLRYTSTAPGYLSDFFVEKIPSGYELRAAPVPLFERTCRTESLRKSFTISTTRLWNLLPSTIREAPSLSSFKSLLFAHIFSAEGAQ